MDRARDENGRKVYAHRLNAGSAKGRIWYCVNDECGALLDPVVRPGGLKMGSSAPIYFRKAQVAEDGHQNGHLSGCLYDDERVQATMEMRVVKQMLGRPNGGPVRIDFDRSYAVQRATFGPGDAAERAKGRYRVGPGTRAAGGEHRFTCRTIEPACRFYLEHPEAREQNILVPGVHDADRYRTVFRSLIFAGEACRHRIWFAPLAFGRSARVAGESLLLEIVVSKAERLPLRIDLSLWPSAARKAFGDEVKDELRAFKEAYWACDRRLALYVFVLADHPAPSSGLAPLDAKRICLVPMERSAAPSEPLGKVSRGDAP